MSKIKFDDNATNCVWEAIGKWRATGNGDLVDKAVQRLIKKYVKRERKRLARVMQPTTITEDGLIEILKREREDKHSAKWPADFPGKH